MKLFCKLSIILFSTQALASDVAPEPVRDEFTRADLNSFVERRYIRAKITDPQAVARFMDSYFSTDEEVAKFKTGFQNDATLILNHLDRALNKEYFTLLCHLTTPKSQQLSSLRIRRKSPSDYLYFLPPEITNLVNLRVLNLSFHKLTALPKGISAFEKLHTLYLCNNNFTKIPPELFELSKLVNLDIAGNKLTEIPACIAQLTELKNVYADNNSLVKLPDSIASLMLIRNFTVNNNPLNEVELAKVKRKKRVTRLVL